MKLGFNWQLGPFELWDAAGVEGTVARVKKDGRPVAANAEKLLAAGKKSWYADEVSAASGRAYLDVAGGGYKPAPASQGVWSVEIAKKKSGGVVKKNAGASLIDLGDGVGCIEFHSKMNALGGDIVQLVTQTLKPGGPGDGFDAFVISNDAQHFSVGANIMLLLMAIQEEDWDEVDLAIRSFQGMTQAIKFSAKPVVVAPFGMALGGGCEVSLHAAARQPHAELYIGLVEVGVGLMSQREYMSDHEVKSGNKVAEVLCGGNVSPGMPVSEQYFLDVEREGFKSLCGEKKTQERIQYTLKTGKTLRN